jgi:N-methylhydantoinase A/oxoprolinase/acetone carboxylase beta subunit
LQNLRVAVDVGGTFTDICIMDETRGLIRIEKTASSKDPIDGIMSGVSKAAIDLGKVGTGGQPTRHSWPSPASQAPFGESERQA